MCPSCHSTDVSRSRKRKLKDRFMRWMGKVAYRCRECHRRFYVSATEDKRLRKIYEWKKGCEEKSNAAQKSNRPMEEDPLAGYGEDFKA